MTVDQLGDPATFAYTVELFPTDLGLVYFVSGSISITNPNDDPATIASIEDVLSDSTVAEVTCTGWDQVEPFELAGGGTLTCSYVAQPDTEAEENTVTVTTNGDIAGDTETVAISYAYPDNGGTLNGCVVVADDMAQELHDWDDWTVIGKACAWNEPEDLVFAYEITFTPTEADLGGATCGFAEYTNRAKLWLLGNEYRDDMVTVSVEVPCEEPSQHIDEGDPIGEV